jgi:hypothetical protein
MTKPVWEEDWEARGTDLHRLEGWDDLSPELQAELTEEGYAPADWGPCPDIESMFVASGIEIADYTPDDPRMHERARLAAAAPEMARLLLEAEWSSGTVLDVDGIRLVERFCFWCGGRRPVGFALHRRGDDKPVLEATSGGHKPDCRWLAVMRRIGAR